MGVGAVGVGETRQAMRGWQVPNVLPVLRVRSMRGWHVSGVLGVLLLAGCAQKPPPDLAPDPLLLGRITDIRMRTWPERVCPGGRIEASYEAVLDDGSVLPFSTKYDKNSPPPLHVVFLRFTSGEAAPRENGHWGTYPDPLLSANDGFRLSAFLRDKPSVNTFEVVEPEYSCMAHVFAFEGTPGGDGGRGGGPGPDVVARLDIVRSPFYDRLLVAEISVNAAPPVYVMADADLIPPADWVVLESRGGRGGPGSNGTDGKLGAAGEPGCPGGPGGAGGAGGNGGAGGSGGPGGEVTLVVPEEQPLLAGMIEVRTPGGEGGPGGKPGKGGAGGAGGAVQGDARRCTAGADGARGPDGGAGSEGPRGAPGPPVRVFTVPRDEVFGPHVPSELRRLLEYDAG